MKFQLTQNADGTWTVKYSDQLLSTNDYERHFASFALAVAAIRATLPIAI